MCENPPPPLISVCEPKTPELKLVRGEPGPGTGTCSRERASYEMTRAIVSLYHAAICIPPAPVASAAYTLHSDVHHQMSPQSNICIGPGSHGAWPWVSPSAAPRAVMMSGDGRWPANGGHHTSHGNMVITTCTTQPKSGLCVYTNPWRGNGHIWIWSLKTDRHLALWIVVISLKCDNTKRSDVTSLKAWTDAGHAPGAWRCDLSVSARYWFWQPEPYFSS